MTVDLGAGATTSAIVYERQGPPSGAQLIFAHGAGAGQRSSFIIDFARALARRGVDVVTFNFLYTEMGRRLPDRGPVLESCYQAVVDAVARRRGEQGGSLFVGGKSMGGRIATQLLARTPELPIAGIVCLGYPLHPPGRPQQLRDAHLPSVSAPVLIVQGSQDLFGTPAELAPVLARMTPPPVLQTIEGGDHGFKVRGGKAAQAAVLERVYDMTAQWMGEHAQRRSGFPNPGDPGRESRP